MIDVTDKEAKELYCSIFTGAGDRSESEEVWISIYEEMEKVVNAPNDLEAVKVIEWWGGWVEGGKETPMGVVRQLRSKWNELHPDRKTPGGEVDGLIDKYIILKKSGEGKPDSCLRYATDSDIGRKEGAFCDLEGAFCRNVWHKKTWSFVLSPEKDDAYGAASRMAMETYALAIENTNPKLAMEILAKVAGFHVAMAKGGKGE